MPALSLRRTARAWLYWTHRWIGIATCLFLAIWFASGLVMIHVPYPSLSAEERAAHAEVIDWPAVDVPPPRQSDGGMPADLSLEMRDGVPVWRVTGWNGERSTIPAQAGRRLPAVDRDYAARVATRLGRAAALSVEEIARDQWTVAGGFDRHRPLWRVTLGDAQGSVLYVSSSTGTVVQATDRQERFWNWLGSIPHWIYPTILRQDDAAWRQVVMWVSGPCVAVAITGFWIGILRTRTGRRRFARGRMTPYHGWMLWHHVAGLAGGVFLIAWIFSGWLSVDPGHVFAGTTVEGARLRRYAAPAPLPPIPLDRLRDVGRGAGAMALTHAAGRPIARLVHPDGRDTPVDLTTMRPARADPLQIAAAARRLIPAALDGPPEMLTGPDAYWYAVHGAPRLPVLRLRFADAARTWLHVDPTSGEVLSVLDRRRRVYRWLFDLLHRWDLNLLTRHPPLRYAWEWSFSLLGLVMSVSGVVIGWRRLVRPRGRPAPRAGLHDIALLHHNVRGIGT